MKIEKGKVVSLAYVVRDAKGHVIQSTEEGNPSDYLHGHSNLIPGLESELESKLAGDEFKIEISPENGYGLWNERKIQVVPREKLPKFPNIKVGAQLVIERDNQKTPVMVIDLDDKNITLDANHPLAGKVLFYEVKIVAVRDATSEEITKRKPHKADRGSEHER